MTLPKDIGEAINDYGERIVHACKACGMSPEPTMAAAMMTLGVSMLRAFGLEESDIIEGVRHTCQQTDRAICAVKATVTETDTHKGN